jgi:hypothetical protein
MVQGGVAAALPAHTAPPQALPAARASPGRAQLRAAPRDQRSRRSQLARSTALTLAAEGARFTGADVASRIWPRSPLHHPEAAMALRC